MAWTAPRTWTVGQLVKATDLNTHLKDNMAVLDAHGHRPAISGDGGASLGNLGEASFTDISAPSAPGNGLTVLYAVSSRLHYRPGAAGSDTEISDANDLHAEDHASRHEPSGADVMTVDAAVGVGSLRTLGSGALQAAAGNHSH